MPTMISGKSTAARRQVSMFALAAGLLVGHVSSWAQAVGEVDFARGVGFAQSTGQTPQTLGKGLALKKAIG